MQHTYRETRRAELARCFTVDIGTTPTGSDTLAQNLHDKQIVWQGHLFVNGKEGFHDGQLTESDFIDDGGGTSRLE